VIVPYAVGQFVGVVILKVGKFIPTLVLSGSDMLESGCVDSFLVVLDFLYLLFQLLVFQVGVKPTCLESVLLTVPCDRVLSETFCEVLEVMIVLLSAKSLLIWLIRIGDARVNFIDHIGFVLIGSSIVLELLCLLFSLIVESRKPNCLKLGKC
jgi:hypothetical protein